MIRLASRPCLPGRLAERRHLPHGAHGLDDGGLEDTSGIEPAVEHVGDTPLQRPDFRGLLVLEMLLRLRVEARNGEREPLPSASAATIASQTSKYSFSTAGDCTLRSASSICRVVRA